MRIKITEKGWAGYTGNYGGIEFKNGESVEDVPVAFYDRIAASIRVHCLQTGKQVGIQQRLIDGRSQKMEDLQEAEKLRSESLSKKNIEEAPKQATPPKPELKIYTEEELGQVVEAKGINGLREIAVQLGVKARAIPDLVRAILQAQAELKQRSIVTAPVVTPPVPAPASIV